MDDIYDAKGDTTHLKTNQRGEIIRIMRVCSPPVFSVNC